MKLVYVLDHRFYGTPDGAVWTDTSYDADFWEPYLCAFDRLTLVSKIQQIDSAELSWKRVDSPRITVCPIPHYLGAMQFLLRQLAIRRMLRAALAEPCAVMLRTPSALSNCAYRELRRLRKPYAVEVVGDSHAALAPGVIRAWGRALFRWRFTQQQKLQSAHCSAASYVAKVLHERYPASSGARTLICSDVRLQSEWLRDEPRVHAGRAMRLVTVATLSQTYKGLDVLLNAVAACHQRGTKILLTLVGHGKLRDELEAQATQLGIAEFVTFTGAVPWGEKLIAELDRADVFVLPSRVEALPRALLEAMARGLPCIGTRVGAVPELLEREFIVSAGDSEMLAAKIMALAHDRDTLDLQSKRNLDVARGYAYPLLRLRWNEFYQDFARSQADSFEPAGVAAFDPA